MNSTKLFNLIQKQAPPKYIVPAGLKSAFENAKSVQNLFLPQIQAGIDSLISTKPTSETPRYKALFDLYQKEYENGAAQAMAQTIAQANANDAGFGNSYANAAAEQAFNSYMADRGTAVPVLLAAAEDSNANEINARANGISAMQSLRDARTQGAQALFNAQQSLAEQKQKAEQQAYATRLGGLTDLYSIATAGSSGGSSSSGRRRSSSGSSSGFDVGYVGENEKTQKGSTKVSEGLKTAWTIYDNAIKNYPALKGVLSPPGHSRTGGMYMNDYATYVKEQINKLLHNKATAKKKLNSNNLVLQTMKKK